MEQRKTCSICNEEKIIGEFYLCWNKEDSRNYYYSYCKSCCKKKSNKYKKQNRDRVNKVNATYMEIYRKANPDKKREWHKANKGRVAVYAKKHSEKVRKRCRERWWSEKNYRLRILFSHRLWMALKGTKKRHKTLDLLGCSIDKLVLHLESLFQEGMTWDNYGRDGWHLDHIIPCSMFELVNSEEQEICFHYTNLQPLWAHDNLSKNSRFIG